MAWRTYLVLFVLPLVSFGAEDGSKSAKYWREKSQRELEQTLKYYWNTNKTKNIILFISDGMGISQTTAARIMKGNITGTPGEEGLLFYETFPNLGLPKVYSNNSIIPDSASTATAILSGVKVNCGTLGLSSEVARGNCSASLNPEYRLENIFDHAQQAGKHTGIVTNTRITHATPGAAYAFSADRKWESDKGKPSTAAACDDIALQFVRNNVSKNFKVAFGGGWGNFLPKSLNGTREDGRNLIEEWKQNKTSLNISHSYVNSSEQLESIDLNKSDQILGLFAPSHLPYFLEKSADSPSLEEMVKVAITKLKQSEEGFVLMVESGIGDRTMHLNQAKKGLYEVLELEKAVIMAKNLTSDSDTLIIITSDHSQSLVINGNAPRGSNILGLAEKKSEVDGLPYTVLNFGNGPGFKKHVLDHNLTRWNLTDVDVTADDFVQTSAGTPRFVSHHSGEDVAIYALGPMGHLLGGVHEENYIFDAMCYASCICGSGYSCHGNSTN